MEKKKNSMLTSERRVAPIMLITYIGLGLGLGFSELLGVEK